MKAEFHGVAAKGEVNEETGKEETQEELPVKHRRPPGLRR